MGENEYVFQLIVAGAAGAFAIAARIVENAGTKLMNARRRATSEG